MRSFLTLKLVMLFNVLGRLSEHAHVNHLHELDCTKNMYMQRMGVKRASRCMQQFPMKKENFKLPTTSDILLVLKLLTYRF